MREHIPFGPWLMGIEHPYSLGVKDGGQFWSCGQCPLDTSARTVFPDDLEAQVRFTAGLIRDQFGPAGVTPRSIAKLVVYYAEGGPTGIEAAVAAARDVLGPVPLIIPIGVPHFYYPGMLTEIDVYAGTAPAAEPIERAFGAARILAVRSGPLVHALVSIAGASGREAFEFYRSQEFSGALQSVLRQAGTRASAILSARLFAARSGAFDGFDRQPDGNPICPDPVGAIIADLAGDTVLAADLVFLAETERAAHSEPALRSNADRVDGVLLTACAIGPYLCLQGRLGQTAARTASLPEQTRLIMETFRSTLADRGCSFADVVKQQAHYVGSASESDLYDNMRVRNGYYAKPGPASTGLPVFGFLEAGPAIAIELLAVRS